MSEDNGIDFILFILIFVIAFLGVMAFYFNILSPFLRDREYIKMEMTRTTGREYMYWKHELKILYVSHIPIIGRLITKFMR